MNLEKVASSTPEIGVHNYSNIMIPSEDAGLSLMSLVSSSKAGTGSALPGYLLEAVDLAHEQFSQFIASPDLDYNMNLVFDNNWDRQAFQKVVQDVKQSGFRNLVEIDVLTGIQLNGANAVFAEETNTIYFSEDFLLKNASNPEAISSVFHEEFGHWLDSKINTFDALGDEGELFQKVVQNESLNADDLFLLKTENDHSTIVIDGKTLSIEMSNSDFDGDGKSDILWRNSNGQIGTWLINGSSVKAGANIGNPVGQDWQIENVGDFDGDGKSDILWRNSNGQIGTWLMNGSSVKANANIGNPVGQDWQIENVGDFDGDGKSDILWRNSNGQIGTWLINGSSVKAGANIGNPVGQDWQIENVGDFDGDGKSDILWRNSNGQIGTWLMNGSSVKANANIGNPVGQDWQIENVGDFDGDGKSDILWRNSNGQIGTWLINGSSVKAGANIGNPVGQDWQIENVGDFDGDGKSDILWRNSNGQIGTWLMNGSSVKANANIGNPVGQEWQIEGTNSVDNTTLAPIPKGNHEDALLTQPVGLDYFKTRPEFYTTGNIFWKNSYAPIGLQNPDNTGTEGNCTWYAHGRLKELGGNAAALNSMSGNANQWHNQLSSGATIVDSNDVQFGDIAQWTRNGMNHVAVVERVYIDSSGVKKVVVSESHYRTNYDGGGEGTLHRIFEYRADNPDRYIRVPRA